MKNGLNLKRRRGSFTPSVALLLVFFILLATLTIDYSRFNSVQPIVQAQLSNALDIALMDYDAALKDGYDLYGFGDGENVRRQIEYYLAKALDEQLVMPYQVTVESVTVDGLSGGIVDKETLRQMIIQNHSKAFIANQLTDWLERLDLLRDLGDLIAMVEQFNDIVKSVSKLDRMYNDLKDLYDEFADWYSMAKNFDGAAIATDLKDLYAALADVDDDISNYQAQIEEDDWAVFQNDWYDQQLNDMLSERNRIAEKIDEVEDVVLDFIESADSVFELLSKTRQFSDQLAVVCDDVQVVIDALPTESLSDYNDGLGEIVAGIEQYANDILGSLRAGNAAFNQQVTALDDLATELQHYLDLLADLLGDEPFDADAYQNDLTLEGQITFSVIDILLRQDEDDAPFDFGVVLDALYDMGRHVVEQQFDYDLGEIPRDIYAQLPSRSLGQIEPLFELGPRSAGGKWAKSDDLQAQMTESVDLTKQLSSAMLSSTEKTIEKMIIADYVLHYFSYHYRPAGDNPPHNPYFSRAEVEYIINGDRLGSVNALMTETGIYGMRTALNALSILAFKQTELNIVSGELAAMTGGVSYPLIYGLCVIGWSAIESGIDISQLKAGERVVFFKLANNINFDLSVDALLGSTEQNAALAVVDELNPLAFDYGDYLFLMLLAQDETVILERIADMVSLSNLLDGAKLADYKTELTVTLNYRIDSWFGIDLAAVADHLGSKVFTVQLKRGY